MSQLVLTQTTMAALSMLYETFCKREGHQHPLDETWICGEAILARSFNSTGLATIKPVEAPPRLIDFHNAKCATKSHAHTAAGAAPCLDKALRAQREAAIERLNHAMMRAAAAARPSNDESSSTKGTATNSLVTRETYGYGNAKGDGDAKPAPREA